MNGKCGVAWCQRAPIQSEGGDAFRFCEQHTRMYLTAAFGRDEPEWVSRAKANRLPYRIEGGRAA